MSWKLFPKVELHLHLEGAADPAFIRGLAAEKSVDIQKIFDKSGAYKYDSFNEFLAVYEAATFALKSPEDFKRLTQSVLENLAEHNVVYAETFVSPDFCGGRDVGAWREYLEAMQEAHVEGVTLKGIVTCIRHFGPDKARETARCAAETAGDWIVGFGMGGAEDVGAAADFARAFDMAREAGLRLTSHAGEWGGAQSIWDTLEDLKVERIGHGVQAIDDPKLVDYLAETGIVLEVNPGSNIALGVYANLAQHPIAKLRDAGVKVTVSTDDPPFFQTTMTKEFERLEQVFGWGVDDFNLLNKTALEAAFCDAGTKDLIAKRLETV
jgi:adenosine deaminase|tara:strand:+ start:10099 stop:11070 length:972 start_codon:yes stop_codon:yes gene_type:complete